jgi:hypothetical protein
MGFAEEVAAATSTRGSNIGHATRVLNALPARQRKQLVAFLDNPPDGYQKAAVAIAINNRVKKAGLDMPKVTAQHISTFQNGSRHGLLT